MNQLLDSPRFLNFMIFLVCAGCLGAAIFIMEGIYGMEPCKLCMFQRVAFAGIGFFALLSSIINPRRVLRFVLGIPTVVSAVLGVALAMRHLYLQNLPKDQVPDCGPALDYMMQMMPLTDVVKSVLSGSGDCAEISARFLGITIPGWTLVALAGLLIMAIYANCIACSPHDR